MDLIYTDPSRKDVGVLKDYTFDLAFGSDENDFELVLDVSNHCCETNCLVYIEGTEYGGIIDKINVVTKDHKLTYKGRTWQGILASKVIEPPAKEPYLIVSGDANSLIGDLLKRLGLTDLFRASDDISGLTIRGYAVDRYIDGYSGIMKMLESVSGKLKFTFADSMITVSALPIVDYSKDEQFDSDQVEMEIEKAQNAVNHLICLGVGELQDRQVIHLYVNELGEIGKVQTFVGLQEVVAVHDHPNAESLDELENSGKEKLQEYSSAGKVQMDFSAEETVYDIGDIIGAKEITTDIFASERITKKIVTISNGMVNINYKVGE